MIRIYVAHPIGPSDEGRAIRIKSAVDAGAQLLRAGLSPFVPGLWAAAMADHETTADELMDYEAWMAYDFEWLSTCAAVLRLPGDSPGADREVDAALNAGKPVFYSTAGIIAHFGGSHVPA
jgi:hypothetical protein